MSNRYGPKPKSPEERFWKHVAPSAEDECWEWQGARTHDYGYLYISHSPMRFKRAHRLSWEIHHGPIPEGYFVLHRCDNPPCVNPRHLYLGGHGENARDRAIRKRGREARQNGVRNANAKLTEAQVREIIAELKKLPRRSQADIAKEFGVKQPQISNIMLRKSWAHLWKDE
jgi:hypothetical protein